MRGGGGGNFFSEIVEAKFFFFSFLFLANPARDFEKVIPRVRGEVVNYGIES